jgi:hypothetical protein
MLGNMPCSPSNKRGPRTQEGSVSKVARSGGGSPNTKITILGRKRNIIIQKGRQYVKVQGELMLLSKAEKLAKQTSSKKNSNTKQSSSTKQTTTKHSTSKQSTSKQNSLKQKK